MMQNIESKKCNKCNEIKDITAFSKCHIYKDGHMGMCKECRSIRRKEEYKENPELRSKSIEKSKIWQQQNPEKYKENQDKYRIENADDLKLKKSNYQRENWDARKNYHKKWCNRNQKHVRAYCKKQLAKSRENLDDWYIRSMLSQNSTLKSSDIPHGLVEAKKEQIKIKRLINELSN